MKPGYFLPIALFLALILAQDASALPRFALMAGARCQSCHINPTGGQMRNDYGTTSYSKDVLPLKSSKDEGFEFDPKISETISLGADYRSQIIYSAGADPTDGEKGKVAFHAMTTSLYGAISLSRKITFYAKQDFLNAGYAGTEAYGVARLLPRNGYIKGGVFMPDFGLRLDDHTAYTRGGDLGVIPGGPARMGLLFTQNYKDVGFEVGTYFRSLFITAGLFNGNGGFPKIDFSKDKAYTLKIDYMRSMSGGDVNVRFGLSGYGYKSFKMGGIYAGFHAGAFTLLGEMDWTNHQLDYTTVIEDVNSMAAFLEAQYRIIQGLSAVGRFDFFDPLQGEENSDLASATNTMSRVVLGFEFYPYSYVELRPQYRLNMETPSVGNDAALMQIHLWF